MTRRRRSRIQLIKSNCPRCEREIYRTNRSIHNATAAHAKYTGICKQCTTPEEKQEMLNAIGNAISQDTRKGL